MWQTARATVSFSVLGSHACSISPGPLELACAADLRTHSFTNVSERTHARAHARMCPFGRGGRAAHRSHCCCHLRGCTGRLRLHVTKGLDRWTTSTTRLRQTTVAAAGCRRSCVGLPRNSSPGTRGTVDLALLGGRKRPCSQQIIMQQLVSVGQTITRQQVGYASQSSRLAVRVLVSVLI